MRKKTLYNCLILSLILMTCSKSSEKDSSSIVNALIGLQSKENYLKVINEFSEKAKPDAKISHSVHEMTSVEEHDTILQNAGDKLIIIDLYADWCAPCKKLSPLLEEIAKENKNNAEFYKVNIDKLKVLSEKYTVGSIPYVVFVKNKNL